MMVVSVSNMPPRLPQKKLRLTKKQLEADIASIEELRIGRGSELEILFPSDMLKSDGNKTLVVTVTAPQFVEAPNSASINRNQESRQKLSLAIRRSLHKHFPHHRIQCSIIFSSAHRELSCYSTCSSRI
jgi:hypothetical protein